MIELSCVVERQGETSLVELLVVNETSHPRRVRVANRLDGPVWPPRKRGAPDVGWDDGGFEGVVDPGERVGLGYACPGAPTEPPAEIVWSEREASESRDERPRTAGATSLGPADVCRLLDDPRPPRDVVESTTGAAALIADESFTGVEARIERAEVLAEAVSVSDAARAIENEGDLRAVERLVERLQDDAEALGRAGPRARALASRAETIAHDVPLAAFRRLA